VSVTEPSTKAGRRLRDYLRDSFVYEADDTEPIDVTDYVLAVETEARELDVERLARALRAYWSEDPNQKADETLEHDYAEGLAAEYAAAGEPALDRQT
jgi:hypothetical protein